MGLFPSKKGLRRAGTAACGVLTVCVLAVCLLTDPAIPETGPAGSVVNADGGGGYYEVRTVDLVTDPPTERDRSVDPGFSAALPNGLENTDPSVTARTPEENRDAGFALSPASGGEEEPVIVSISPGDGE